MNLMSKNSGKCRPDEFQCKDDSGCVPRSGLCDHFPDCSDSSDESDDVCKSKDLNLLAWDDVEMNET